VAAVAKSWLVLSPKRTGSLAIVRSLYALYNYDANKFNYVSPSDSPHSIQQDFIIHTHNIDWIEFVTENTEVIISVRDPVESSLSWCIQPLLKEWHFYPWQVDKVNEIKKIEGFYLNPKDFIQSYENTIQWYNDLKIKDSYKILNYADWKDNPSTILTRLGYDTIAKENRLTLKNPGMPERWIKNYDEISDIANKLSREIPLSYL